jgi:two-component sensor histidine kinase
VVSAPIRAFDKALERLGAQDMAKAHTRAQIEMFRGQLRERKGDLARAVEDYRKASVSDPQNMYMKVRLLRGLRDLRLRAQRKADQREVEHRSKELAEVVAAILGIDPRHVEAGRAKVELAAT